MVTRRAYLGGIVSTTGISGIAGCAGDSPEYGAFELPQRGEIGEPDNPGLFDRIIITAHPYMWSIPHEVAHEMEYYEEAGLDSPNEVIAGPGGLGALRNLLAGEVPIAVVSGTATIKAYIEGHEDIVVLSHTTESPIFLDWWMEAETAREHDYVNLGDARGMDIGYLAPGASPEYLAKTAVYLQEGITHDDVEFTSLGDVGSGLAGLREGEVDMGLIPPALKPLFKSTGYIPAWNPGNYIEASLGTIWVAERSTLEDNLPEFKAFIDAQRKATQFLHEAEDEEEKFDDVVRWYTDWSDLYTNEENARRDVEAIRPLDWWFTNSYEKEGLATAEVMLKLANDLEKSVPFEEFIWQGLIPEEHRIDLSEVPRRAFGDDPLPEKDNYGNDEQPTDYDHIEECP